MTPQGKTRIEAFDPLVHDRNSFSCGVEAVDNFLKRTAAKLTRADNLRVFAMVEGEAFLGFYALNAHAIEYEELPPAFARSRPGHGSIPAAFISMIGIDSRFQGRGYGGDLLTDALIRVARASDQIGIAVVILDIIDCGNPDAVARRKRLYEGYGFRSLASRPSRLFLPVATFRQSIPR